jgi:hypothetical protein
LLDKVRHGGFAFLHSVVCCAVRLERLAHGDAHRDALVAGDVRDVIHEGVLDVLGAGRIREPHGHDLHVESAGRVKGASCKGSQLVARKELMRVRSTGSREWPRCT